MNILHHAEETEFRDEVRAFVEGHLPADISSKVLGHRHLIRDDYVRWQRILYQKGWGAPIWPKAHGGTGWSPIQRLIFEIECFRAGAPRPVLFGLNMIGPVLMKYGSEAQKARFLPRIAPMEDFWCQGYSEPGAGSDLAALKTRAIRVGDKYVVTGQKIWTTFAHWADWMFCLVCTDPDAKAQESISMLLIDMKSPGIRVQPIVTLDGGSDINEVFLDGVEVPLENLVGVENKGWTYAKYLLGHERTGIVGVGHCRRELRQLKHYASQTMDGYGQSLLQSGRIRDKVAQLEMELMALEMMLLKTIRQDAGEKQGPEVSVLKIRGSELQQQIAMVQLEVIGPDAWPFSPAWLQPGVVQPVSGPQWAAPAAAAYFDMRKASIYGGTTEVQKNIISKIVLGL
ncbi:MAG: acyl-CoA dehydrogenase family protein [Sulfuricaulis sp.]|nr:acyl-CoA dehydrogenase family protein [Sulfuricaulis sp.]